MSIEAQPVGRDIIDTVAALVHAVPISACANRLMLNLGEPVHVEAGGAPVA